MLLTAPHEETLDGPVIFLAGPIQGVHSWQDEATRLLLTLDPDVHIANPRRPWDTEADFDEAAYREQVDWETRYLRRAGRYGVVLFWLARDRNHRCERAHAQTTRFELAEWKERHRTEGAHLVVGIEEGFSGARYIRARISSECPAVPLCASLEDTCRAAIGLSIMGSAEPTPPLVSTACFAACFHGFTALAGSGGAPAPSSLFS